MSTCTCIGSITTVRKIYSKHGLKWELPGTIQAARIINDAVTVVSQQEDEYTIGTIELDELPSGNIVATSSGFTGNVPLDMATRPVSPAGT